MVVLVVVGFRNMSISRLVVFLLIVKSSWSSIFTLPTLMMHGQTQIKCTGVFITGKKYCFSGQEYLLFG
jgi:hypothetical protein